MQNIKKRIQLLTLAILPGLSTPLLACPDMQGSYKTENGGTQFYLQKDSAGALHAVIDISGYPLTTKTATFVSDTDRNAQPYQVLPECTLSIDGFGYILPHEKGSVFRLHFDSQDYEKVFNTEYILTLSDAPSGNLGVNKTTSTLPAKAIAALGEH